jgi:hypothetical protein
MRKFAATLFRAQNSMRPFLRDDLHFHAFDHRGERGHAELLAVLDPIGDQHVVAFGAHHLHFPRGHGMAIAHDHHLVALDERAPRHPHHLLDHQSFDFGVNELTGERCIR